MCRERAERAHHQTQRVANAADERQRGGDVSVVVGVAPDGRSTAAVRLAAVLARSAGEDMVLATVVPAHWPPGVGRIDAEYQAYLKGLATAALDQARAELPPDVAVTARAVHARSVPRGLIEAADGASVLVVGSSAAGPLGRVSLGSVGEHLLHACSVPVALVPRGYGCDAGTVVTRVTAAFGGDAESADLVVAAAGLAVRVGAVLRVASFAVRPAPPRTIATGPHIEDAVVDEWVEYVDKAQQRVLEQVAGLPVVPRTDGAVVGRGHDWADALADVEWTAGDVLVVGSSTAGPLERVFLGSRASKIVRNAPVPVVALPRGAVAQLADEAERA
jgi:nucleotide-binding universal stress UspA family protein